MSESNSAVEADDGRYPLAMPSMISPAFASDLSRGKAKGTVQGRAVETGTQRFRLKVDNPPEDGTEVVVREGDEGLYCKTVKQVEKEKREKERRRQERKRKREHEQDRKRDRRRAEALRFWAQYDIPFTFDVRIKQRKSGLSRGSWGDGRAADTVEHLYVREAFDEGRLSREADRFLCNDDAHMRDREGISKSDTEGNPYTPQVTCKTCLKRMKRWKQGSEDNV